MDQETKKTVEKQIIKYLSSYARSLHEKSADLHHYQDNFKQMYKYGAQILDEAIEDIKGGFYERY